MTKKGKDIRVEKEGGEGHKIRCNSALCVFEEKQDIQQHQRESHNTSGDTGMGEGEQGEGV